MKRTRDLHSKAIAADAKAISEAQQAVTAAQEKLDAANATKAQREQDFLAEEAKLLEALRKAEVEPAPAGQPAERIPETHHAASETDLLNRIQAFVASAEGRAALAMRGIITSSQPTSPPHRGETEIPTAQVGDVSPSESDIEALGRCLPVAYHAGLAHRLN